MADSGQSYQDKSKAGRYFILAYISLFMLALLWSVANAFVYLFLGLAGAFIFLGLHHFIPAQKEHNDRRDSESYQRQQRRPDYKQPSGTSQSNKSSTPKIPKVIGVVFAVGMLILFVSVFVTVFSDDSDSMYYYQQGDNYYQTGKYDSAALFFRQSLAINPDYTDALSGYGKVKVALEQNDSAIIFYNKVIAISPENEEALYQKGRVLSFQKNYDESISLLKSLIKLDSGHNEAIQLIGDCFYNKQKYDSALQWYNVAYKTGFRNTYLCYLMGYIYETKNKTDEAITLYKEAIEYNDTIADLFSRLGTLMPGPEGESYRTKASALEAMDKTGQ